MNFDWLDLPPHPDTATRYDVSGSQYSSELWITISEAMGLSIHQRITPGEILEVPYGLHTGLVRFDGVDGYNGYILVTTEHGAYLWTPRERLKLIAEL